MAEKQKAFLSLNMHQQLLVFFTKMCRYPRFPWKKSFHDAGHVDLNMWEHRFALFLPLKKTKKKHWN